MLLIIKILAPRLQPMSTHKELEAQIRFQLSQLSALNAHHEFEHLCRNLARIRICSNILPATGPVTSGGDQGRDFETHETELTAPTSASLFTGMTSGRRLAFGCSLQKSSIGSKIKTDVATITGTGQPVHGIHFFCESDLPVAKRHELQK